MKAHLQAIAAELAGIIAPARCLNCLREGTWLCSTCQPKLPAYKQRCIICSHPQPRGVVCNACHSQTTLDGTLSAGSYSWPWLRRGVHWLKFKGVRPVADVLAPLLAKYLTAIAPLPTLQQSAALVPIPLHRRRLRLRGFNQSLDVAYSLRQVTGIPVLDILERQRSTWTQTKLPTQLRQQNVRDAFRLRLPVLPAKQWWLLIDDVTTSGSTLSAAAATLHQAGAQQLWGVTVARG